MKTRYIQRQDRTSLRRLETVDEFPFNTGEERREARRCLGEYRLSDPSGNYYLSRRACKEWSAKHGCDYGFWQCEMEG